MRNIENKNEKGGAPRRLRLGFIGTGWIGRMRLQSLLQAEMMESCTVYDSSVIAAAAAAALSADISVGESFADLLNGDLDGLVIATPNAQHAEQCLQAFAGGKAVFCQKPLARTLTETQRVVDAARAADRLLSVDFCYRYLTGMAQLKEMIGAGELGEVFSADLIFHNGYGPDKPWFYEMCSAGGGCVMDLGIHLIDLALWLLGDGPVEQVSSSLFQSGKKLQPPYEVVEDYAMAEFNLKDTHLRLCCSWNLHAGREAVIKAQFYGTKGGAAVRNVNGSFYDFEICRFDSTRERIIGGYPDSWGGRALLDWAAQLGAGSGFDSRVEQVVQVAEVIDRIYCR